MSPAVSCILAVCTSYMGAMAWRSRALSSKRTYIVFSYFGVSRLHCKATHSAHLLRLFHTVDAEINLDHIPVFAPLLKGLEQAHAVATHAFLWQHVLMHDAGRELPAKDVLFQHDQ